MGFEKQVVFSSFCAGLVFRAPDDSAYATATAHNRAMHDFCASDPRLLGIAMVPLQDVALALSEINHARELGLKGIWIGADAHGGRSPGHTANDPIWAALSEAGIPFILHVGSSEINLPDPWMNDGNPAAQSARGGAEVIGSKDLTVIHHGAQRFISALILDGVLERFPNLKGGVIEIGAGWVPDMLRRLDHAVDIWARSEPQLAKMRRKPSEQARDQLRFTPYPFEDVARMVAESSAELYMFSSDYPHAEGGRDPSAASGDPSPHYRIANRTNSSPITSDVCGGKGSCVCSAPHVHDAAERNHRQCGVAHQHPPYVGIQVCRRRSSHRQAQE